MSIQLASKYDPTQPYHTYYDLSAINNDATGISAPVSFQMTQTRNNPYLMAPENYYLSVVRFTLQTPSLPLFIPQVLVGQSDPNKTVYSLSIAYTYSGAEYISQQYITYVSPDITQPTPSAPTTEQDKSSDYYYLFNLQDWCKMMNTALIASYTALNGFVIAAGGTLPSNNVPFFEWNSTNQVFQLSADNAGYSSSLGNPIKIYMNTALNTLLNNFPIIKGNPSSSSGNYAFGKNFQFNFYNNNGLNLYNMGTYSVIQLYQDNSTVGLFNPVLSIVFTSSLLPIVQSVVGNTKSYNTTPPTQNNNTAPIITDFVVPYSATNQYRPNLEYTPSGEYRLIDLYGLTPLQSIEITVQWSDMFGVLHPFQLLSGCSAQLKLMFRRRDFGNVPRLA
jgi:hypothetical protein